MVALDALDEPEMISFDRRSQSWRSGIGADEITALRSWWRGGASRRLWTVMGIVSADGFERQDAIEQVQLRRGTVALIALRTTDWVPQVRHAALIRLAEAPEAVLLDLLPLLDVLTQERVRAADLDALVERRLSDDDLRAATHSGDVLARRAGWRRLVARGRAAPAELCERAVHDPDAVVRSVAAGQLGALDESDRRVLATALVGDRLGWLAGPGLDALVELDGAPAIVSALTDPKATLRRRARDWARVRDVDARAIYLERLQRDPSDALALTALAEIGNRADDDILRRALADPRSRVRAAALRAVARFDRQAAKAAAMDAITASRSGRVGRVAVAVLQAASLGDEDLRRVELVALDADRSAGQRLRALELLRPARWRHLAALLQARDAAESPLLDVLDDELRTWRVKSGNIHRGPDPAHRQIIEAALPALDEDTRQWITFVLRTAA